MERTISRECVWTKEDISLEAPVSPRAYLHFLQIYWNNKNNEQMKNDGAQQETDVQSSVFACSSQN